MPQFSGLILNLQPLITDRLESTIGQIIDLDFLSSISSKYSDFMHMLINKFYSEQLNAEITETLAGIKISGKWTLTIKIYPTIKELRTAGIDEYVMWKHQNALRICFAVPLNYDKEEFLYRETSNPITDTMEPRCHYTKRRGNIIVFPQSLNKAGSVLCSTKTPKRRIVEHKDNGFLACFQLSYTVNDNIGNGINLMDMLFGSEILRHPSIVPDVCAISLNEILNNDTTKLESKVVWNIDHTKLQRIKETKTSLKTIPGESLYEVEDVPVSQAYEEPVLHR